MRKYFLLSCHSLFISLFAGRPKFKISQHPDGYSVQIGHQGYYMRVRHTSSYGHLGDSIDFSIMDYKGSIKYRVDGWRGINSKTMKMFEIV